MREETCRNCKHSRRCKRLTEGQWQWFRICAVFADEPDGWCIAVDDDDMCEMFLEETE